MSYYKSFIVMCYFYHFMQTFLTVIFLVAAQHFSTLTTLHICLIREILMVEYNDSPRHYALVM